MSAPATLDPAHTAVLSMDLQSAIVGIYAKGQEGPLLARVASVLSSARTRGVRIIHIQFGFRPNLPEASSRNMLLGAIKRSPKHQQLFLGAAGAVHPTVAPEGDDILIVKHRVSAFMGTDLEMILRSADIDTLVLFGIATSGVVLSTLLVAADMDYRLMVVKDCCADLDLELHACLIDKLFPRQAMVLSADQFVAALARTQS